MTSPVSPSLQSMQHDKTYYIHGGDLVFLVENILFRVHRFFFERESVYFKTLFATPHPENEPTPGSSDSSAIMLDTTASQFSRFVWVFYNPKYSLYDEASLDDWKSILELSQRWLFPEVKKLAVRELQKQPLTPVQRIDLYHRNHVDRSLLVGDYLTLCQRMEPLSLNEGLDLGLETTLMIARTREEIRSPRSPEGVMTPLTPTLQGPALIDLIGKMFVGENDVATANGPSTIAQPIGQPATRPVIVINGTTNLNAEKTPTATMLGSNGPKTPGGLASNSQATKPTEPRTPTQQPTRGRNQKDQSTNQRKGRNTNTTSQTTKTAAEVANKDKERDEGKKPSQTPMPIAGQQAGAEGGGENGHNQENTDDSSKEDVRVSEGEAKKMEAGPNTEGGATVLNAQGAETRGTGTGDSPTSNGDTNGALDQNKKTGAEATPTTIKPVGAGGPNHEGTLANAVSTNNTSGVVEGGNSVGAGDKSPTTQV